MGPAPRSAPRPGRVLRRLLRDRRGVSAIEFALVLPVLAILASGMVEFGRLVLLTQKLQNGAFILSDLAARNRTLSETDLANIFLAADNLLEPFDLEGRGTAVVSGVVVDAAGDPSIAWQRSGAGTLEVESAIGAEDGAATLPEVLEVSAGETLVVAEVFYDFVPIFGITAAARVIHKVAYVKPRLGTLDTLQP